MSLKAVTHGVTSLNGETGAITITSPDSSITVGGTGSNITLETSGGGGGTIGGSIAVNQVAVGSGTNTIAGSADLTYDGTTFQAASGKIIKGQYSNLAGSAYINPDGSAVLGTNATVTSAGNLSVPALKVTTAPTTGYVLTSDSAGNATWQASGGGGGSPGGTTTQIQFNNSGAFGGADIYYDAATELTGFQASSPLAVVHAKSTFGQSPASVSAFTASLVAESFPTNASASATIIYQPENSSDANISGAQSDGSGSYLADGSTSLTANIYAYVIIAGQQYYYGTPSIFSFTDNSDGQNFSIPYSWTGLSGAAGYVIQSTGSANNGNPNWSQDVGNVTSFIDDGTNSASAAIPANFVTLNPYPVVNPPADSAGCNPLNWAQSDFSGLYYADGSTSGSYTVVGAINIAGTYYYVGSTTASSGVSDNSDNNNFGISLSWNTITGATDYFVTRSIYNATTGPLSGTKDFGNTTSGLDAGDATWTDTFPSVYSFAGTPRQYQIGGQSLAPDGTTAVFFPTPATYSAMDNNSLPYVIEHDVTLNGNTAYGIGGDPNGNTYNYHVINSATSLIEGDGAFWTSGVVSPTHYGYLANGSNLNRAYEDYGIASSFYAVTSLTATTTDPNDSNYYYVQLTQTLGAGNTDSKILRNINSAGYLTGELTSHLPVSGSDYFDFQFSSWSDGTTVTPTTTYPPAMIAEGHGSSIADPPVSVIKSIDGTYSRLEFQDNTGTQLAYLDTANGLTLNAPAGTINLGTATVTADTLTAAAGADAHKAVIVKQHSGTQSADLMQFQNAANNSTRMARFDKNSTFIPAIGSTSFPGIIIPGGTFSSVPVSGAVEWQGSNMLTFTDSTPTRHIIAATDLAQTFTSNQYFSTTTTLGGGFGQPNMHLTTQTLLSTSGGGDVLFDGAQYYGADSSVYRRFLRSPASSSLTQNYFVFSDANGNITTNTAAAPVIQFSGSTPTELSFPLVSLFQQGIAITTGQSISFGNGSAIAGNPLLSYQAATTPTNAGAIQVTNVTANSNAITLPTAVGFTGRTYVLTNSGTGVVPINTTSSQTIQGYASGTLKLNQYDSIAVVSDGANYQIVSQSNGGGFGAQTAVTGSTSGTAVFAQPIRQTGYKKIIINLAALVGTASYTFPKAFTSTPVVMQTNGLATTIVTSLSTTAVTVTGATTSGYLTIEGY